jgi:Fe2+ or Zn2+ uptake regulation protein
MKLNSDFENYKIELEILAYFLKNQDAQDTLEGILEWWLLEIYIRKQFSLVKEALSRLVDQELVIEIQNTNSQIRYKINQEKLQEIQNMLQNRI